MRRWQNLAAPDDPNSWYDVDGVYPTNSGSYRTVYPGVADELTATAALAVVYAFAADTLSGNRQYIIDSSRIWEYSGSYTDRTGGVSIGNFPYMTQYGDVTICAMGVATPTVKSTGGNFSALAGAPNCEIVAACSNAVGFFNTAASSDGYTISDVGDYTNVTTGEAVTGRLIATPGPITAVVSFGDSFIVFKRNSVYRMRYVGGAVKWISEVIHRDSGCGAHFTARDKYLAWSDQRSVMFLCFGGQERSNATITAWLFDGAGQVRQINPETSIGTASSVPFFTGYSIGSDVFWIWGAEAVYFYSPQADAWGKVGTPHAGGIGAKPATGAASSILDSRYTLPTSYYKASADKLTRYVAKSVANSNNVTSYLQTAMVGVPNAKTSWQRVTPIMRSRVAQGTPSSASLAASFHRERHDSSAASTSTVAESSGRARFDFTVTDNFARFKITHTNYVVDVDDFLIGSVLAGTE